MQWVEIVPELGEVLTHYHQGRAASGGASTPQPPRAHWIGSEPGRIVGKINEFFLFF